MDWILSITTYLTNMFLGWGKGSKLVWMLHLINAVGWIFYALYIKQYGIILLSSITIITDLISAWRAEKTI